ncbi:MAG: hypothetical protein JWM57_1329 [Phycisphaerales bacterium]|nr:hypothetical protein [Phycisphaerales bacterium]
MRPYALSFLLAVIVIAVAVAFHVCVRETNAVRVIEQNGAAISKPIPNVTVFVPQTNTGREKQFGDEQLRYIAPAIKCLSKFNELNLSGSSVTDAGIRHLKAVEELEQLDVCETAVTVDGLLQLQQLPKLRVIAISRAQYSDEALAKLKRAFPKATILDVGT